MKRQIEVFTGGCYLCEEVVKNIQELGCEDCVVKIYDLSKEDCPQDCRAKASQYQIRSVPAVVIDGKLADCCAGRGVDFEVLKVAGLGKALS